MKRPQVLGLTFILFPLGLCIQGSFHHWSGFFITGIVIGILLTLGLLKEEREKEP